MTSPAKRVTRGRPPAPLPLAPPGPMVAPVPATEAPEGPPPAGVAAAALTPDAPTLPPVADVVTAALEQAVNDATADLPADDPIVTAQTFGSLAEALAADEAATGIAEGLPPVGAPDLSGEPVELTRGEYLLWSTLQAVLAELERLHNAVKLTGEQVQYQMDQVVTMKAEFDAMMGSGNPLKMIGNMLAGRKG